LTLLYTKKCQAYVRCLGSPSPFAPDHPSFLFALPSLLLLILPRTDPTRTIQVSFIQKVIRRQYTLIPNSDDSPSESSTSNQAPPSLVIERLDKHDRHLDKLDHQFERIEQMFDQKFEKVEASITELKLEVQKGFHNIESKFQTILSQWLFRAAQLVSSITFTFLIL
jgi:hypothetical protein